MNISDIEKEFDEKIGVWLKYLHDVGYNNAPTPDDIKLFLRQAIKTAFEATRVEERKEDLWANGGFIEGREHNNLLKEITTRQNKFLNE